MNEKLIFGIEGDTNRMMSMLKEVLVVENRQWPAVKHNLLIVLHALANESLCLNALGHIQYPQKLQPIIFNWRDTIGKRIEDENVIKQYQEWIFFFREKMSNRQQEKMNPWNRNIAYVPDQYPIGYFAIPNVIH